MSKRILIIAGEASGDLHGAKLATALLRTDSALKLQGVGGRLMKAAGVELLADVQNLGVVGVVEVLGHWSSIWSTYRRIREQLYREPPNLIVLIDYPEFNLRIARVARRVGVPVVYYISPQVWAWRQGRVKTIARLIDQMLVIFPFEKEFYDSVGMNCEFVGHPLLDDLGILPPKPDLRMQLGLDPERPTVGLLPGSRRQEISRILPVMLDGMSRLKKKLLSVQFVLAVAPSLDPAVVQSMIATSGSHLDVTLLVDRANEVIAASDALVVASGTATLQAAIHEIPMVIVYKVSGLTYLLGRMLIRTKHIGLANLVAGEKIVPELVQSQMTGETMERAVYRILTDAVYTERMRKGLSQVRARLGRPGASSRAAKIIVDFLSERGVRSV